MITVDTLTKIYKIYENPSDRLKEAIFRHTRKHKEFHALKNVSFSINKGETIGIVGRNGSGKSTLLKILSGVLTPTEGSISIRGRVSAILELGAGFNLEYTGRENIYLNGTLQGKSRKEMELRINEILSFAELGEFIDQPVKTYSSGMFARLAFAVAINVDPDILIVDEALAVGDMKFQAKCFRKFEDLKEKGVTILFVGHDVSSIRKFCDRTMWLHNGELVSIGDTLAVTAEYMEFMNTDSDDATIDLKKSTPEQSHKEEASEFNNIINRWGSQPNLIHSVSVINEKGEETKTIKYGEVIRIQLVFNMPLNTRTEDISIAISLKNTMGLDLMVFTTHDDIKQRFKFIEQRNEIVFEFVNYFNELDLVLVAAIEDRSSIQPQYYDYIEGAAYIKSITDKQLFGLIHTPVRKYLRK